MSFYEDKLQVNQQSKTTDMKLCFHHGQIHALFEELIHKPWGCQIWQPLIDIFEQDEMFIVKVDLPGVGLEEINVNVSNTKLIIEGRRTFKNIEDQKLRVSERPKGVFLREIEFFEKLSGTDIEKEYDNGVLIIKIKKDKS